MPSLIIQIKLLLSFFSKTERNSLILFLLLSLVVSISEVFSITLIFPIFGMIENDKIVLENIYLSFIYNLLNFTNIKNFIFLFSIVSIFLMIFTNILNYLIRKRLNYVICNRVSILSNQILQNYVDHKFEFFLSSKKSELLQDVIHEVQLLVFSCLMSLADIFTKTITLFFMLSLLIIIQPKISIVLIIIFLFAYFFILKNSNFKTKNYGDQRLNLDKKRFSLVSDIFQSIQELKIYNTSKYFIDRYKIITEKFADISAKQLNLMMIPKYVLETVIFLVFLFFIIAFANGKIDITANLPVLMIFSISALRILPQTQQIYNAYTKLRFYSKSLNKINKIQNNLTLDKIKKSNKSNEIKVPRNFDQIDIENISFNFKDIEKI